MWKTNNALGCGIESFHVSLRETSTWESVSLRGFWGSAHFRERTCKQNFKPKINDGWNWNGNMNAVIGFNESQERCVIAIVLKLHERPTISTIYFWTSFWSIWKDFKHFLMFHIISASVFCFFGLKTANFIQPCAGIWNVEQSDEV